MKKMLMAALLFAMGAGIAFAKPAAAPPPKANCKMFHKMNDGRWTSTIKSKVGNPKNFVTLEPGLPIDPKLTVAGINVADTVEQLCGGK